MKNSDVANKNEHSLVWLSTFLGNMNLLDDKSLYFTDQYPQISLINLLTKLEVMIEKLLISLHQIIYSVFTTEAIPMPSMKLSFLSAQCCLEQIKAEILRRDEEKLENNRMHQSPNP